MGLNMNNEIALRVDKQLTVDVANLPELIISQIDAISELEKKVIDAEKSAKSAKEYINKNMSSYEEKGKGIFKHKAGNTKDIVEDTQEAIDKLTKAQQLNVVAMKKSFELELLTYTSLSGYIPACPLVPVNANASSSIHSLI